MKTFWILMFVFICSAVHATVVPADGDSWSEYATADAAKADGWNNTCGLSQMVVVSTDCFTGSWSMGIQAIQARWDKPFELIKSVPLDGFLEVRFLHKDSWDGRYVDFEDLLMFAGLWLED